MIRVFIVTEDERRYCVNVDNDADAQALLKNGAKELPATEVAAVFGGLASYAGPENTTVLPDGSISFVAPDVSREKMALLRQRRDSRLKVTDYFILPDYPASEEQRAAVMAYRQALRDLPSQPGAPWDAGGKATPWPVNPLEG